MLNLPMPDDYRPRIKARRKRDIRQMARIAELEALIVSSKHLPTQGGADMQTISDQALIGGIEHAILIALNVAPDDLGSHEWQVVTGQAVRTYHKIGDRAARDEAVKHCAEYVLCHEAKDPLNLRPGEFTKRQADASLAYLRELQRLGEAVRGEAA